MYIDILDDDIIIVLNHVEYDHNNKMRLLTMTLLQIKFILMVNFDLDDEDDENEDDFDNTFVYELSWPEVCWRDVVQ